MIQILWVVNSHGKGSSRKDRRAAEAGGTEQVHEHAPQVPPHLRQAIAAGRKLGVLLVTYRSRVLDKDNLIGGGKPWLDALRYGGYLGDDDPESVEAFYLQRRCKRAEEHVDVFIFVLRSN